MRALTSALVLSATLLTSSQAFAEFSDSLATCLRTGRVVKLRLATTTTTNVHLACTGQTAKALYEDSKYYVSGPEFSVENERGEDVIVRYFGPENDPGASQCVRKIEDAAGNAVTNHYQCTMRLGLSPDAVAAW